MVPPSTPPDLPALVGLMYRADWRALSLSATLTVRTMGEPSGRAGKPAHRMLLHPGGKYRVSPAADPSRVLEVCDSQTAWVIVSAGRPARTRRNSPRRPAGGRYAGERPARGHRSRSC